jgi:hypothetical protein
MKNTNRFRLQAGSSTKKPKSPKQAGNDRRDRFTVGPGEWKIIKPGKKRDAPPERHRWK